MLKLRRRVGEQVRVTDGEGHVLLMTVLEITAGRRGQVVIGFDDAARNYEIERPREAIECAPIERPAIS